MSTLKDITMEGANMGKIERKKLFQEECKEKGIELTKSHLRALNKFFNDQETIYEKKKKSMSEMTFDEIAKGLYDDIPALAEYLFKVQDDLLIKNNEVEEPETPEEDDEPKTQNEEEPSSLPAAGKTEKPAPKKGNKKTSILDEVLSSNINKAEIKQINKEIAAKKGKRNYLTVSFSFTTEDAAILKAILDYARTLDANDDNRIIDGNDFAYWNSILHVATRLLVEKIEAEGRDDMIAAIVEAIKKENARKEKYDKEILELMNKLNH